MLLYRVCVLLLAVLMTTSENVQNKNVATLSGILNVTISGTDTSICHNCLIWYVGIRRIYLIQSTRQFRLYWVEGHSDIMRTFASHCNTYRSCSISEQSTTSFTPYSQPRSTLQQFHTTDKLNELENSMQLLAASTISATIETPSVQRTTELRQWNYEISLFERRQVSRIPVFFPENIVSAQYAEVASIPLPAAVISSIIKQHKVRPILQCMVIAFYREDAVCRECLAMHSVSLAIQTYLLHYKTRLSSAELCIFRSNFETADIIHNCKRSFCSILKEWKASDCDRMIHIFPMHPQLFENQNAHFNKRKHIDGSASSRDQRKSLNDIKQILLRIAYKRMAKIRKRRLFPLGKFLSIDTLDILRADSHVCINTPSSPNGHSTCYTRMLKGVVGARVVIISSRLNATIVVDPAEQLRQCEHACGFVERLEPDDCKLHLGRQMMNIEMYRIPSKEQYMTKRPRNCLLSFHGSTRRIACLGLIKEFFTNDGQRPIIHIISKNSLLVKTPHFSSKLMADALDQIFQTRARESCHRILEVPLEFCSEHRSSLSTSPTQLDDRIAISKFTINIVPVGVWPPTYPCSSLDAKTAASQGCSPQSQLKITSQNWPTYNSIALVQYECEKAKEVRCVACLIQHTEVFFTHMDESGTKGYVWMRQAPSLILKSCVGSSCLSLTFDARRTQIKRPVGLQQLTEDDIYQ